MDLSSGSENEDDDAFGASTMWHADAASGTHFVAMDVVVAAAALGAAHEGYGMAGRVEMPRLTMEGGHSAQRQ